MHLIGQQDSSRTNLSPKKPIMFLILIPTVLYLLCCVGIVITENNEDEPLIFIPGVRLVELVRDIVKK